MRSCCFAGPEWIERHLAELQRERPCCLCGQGVHPLQVLKLKSKLVHSGCLISSGDIYDVEIFPADMKKKDKS